MATLSRNFIRDTRNTNLDIVPVVIIADYEDPFFHVVDAFSTDSLSLEDQTGEFIRCNSNLSKISFSSKS